MGDSDDPIMIEEISKPTPLSPANTNQEKSSKNKTGPLDRFLFKGKSSLAGKKPVTEKKKNIGKYFGVNISQITH